MKKKNQITKNFYQISSLKKVLFAGLVLASCTTDLKAQVGAFPFDPLPSNFNVTINVLTNTDRPFNNKLLGVNIDINASGIDSSAKLDANAQGPAGFSSIKCKEFINLFDPVSIRFPAGFQANVYHWKDRPDPNNSNIIYPADTRVPYDVKPASIVLPTAGANFRLGYPGLVDLHNNPAVTNKGFDVLTVLNINNDLPAFSAQRVTSMLNDNLGVRDFELGNEFFWGNQRSNTIDTEQKYVIRARDVVTAVKAAGASKNITNMKFGIPLSFLSGLPGQTADFTNYNNILTADKSYYDAIIVHKYLNISIESTAYTGTEENRNTLLARKFMNDDIVNYCRATFGRNSNGSSTYKDLWITEWAVGVDASGTKDWTASFLGMADTYLYFVENDDKYKRVNWFQVLNSNGFYKYTAAKTFEITGYGAVYEILRNNLKNTTLYDSVLTAPQLQVGGVNQGVKAVSARLVKGADGKLRIVAVNLTNQTARLAIKFDYGNLYSGSYTQKGIRFFDLNKNFDDAINVDTSGSGLASLPPYSVTVLTGITAPTGVNMRIKDNLQNLGVKEIEKADNDKIKIYPNPSNNGLFTISKETSWKVYSLTGQKILEGNGDKIDISSFAKGIYNLKTESITFKLIYQ